MSKNRLMSKKKEDGKYGPYSGFDSFGSLIHPPVQSCILIDRLLMKATLVVLVCISLRELDFCHSFYFMLNDYH